MWFKALTKSQSPLSDLRSVERADVEIWAIDSYRGTHRTFLESVDGREME